MRCCTRRCAAPSPMPCRPAHRPPIPRRSPLTSASPAIRRSPCSPGSSASDADAARALVASGLDPNWTLEQQQVMTCIRELLAHDVTPTRARVVAHATQHARAALRPDDGTEPFVPAADPSLPPRILCLLTDGAGPGVDGADGRPPARGRAGPRPHRLPAGGEGRHGPGQRRAGGGPPASGPTPAARHGPDRIAGCEAPRSPASLIPVEAGTRHGPRHRETTR